MISLWFLFNIQIYYNLSVIKKIVVGELTSPRVNQSNGELVCQRIVQYALFLTFIGCVGTGWFIVVQLETIIVNISLVRT